MADRPRLVPVLSIMLWCPLHFRKSDGSGPGETIYQFNYGRAVDYATRDDKTLERFGPKGLTIVRDCYGQLTYA
jgi:hypothetical protein